MLSGYVSDESRRRRGRDVDISWRRDADVRSRPAHAPRYLLGGVQINADAKADNELLAVRHFEVRTAAGYVIDKFDALKECLNPGEILRSIR